MQRSSRLTKKQRAIIFVSCLFVSYVALPHVVFAGSKGVKAEDKNDPVQEALIKLATFILHPELATLILHPDNEHFAEMRNYFTLSRLSTIVAALLAAGPLNSVAKALYEPCNGKEEKPEDFEFMWKTWGSLTEDEKTTINNQPYKFLRLRYGINRTAGFFYPIIRLVFIHVIPSTIVLRWGFDEVAANVWQLSVKAFFMTSYGIYLARVVFVFIHTLVSDKVTFAHYFLVPVNPFRCGTEQMWDGPGSRIPGSSMDPVVWLRGFLIWCTIGLELFLRDLLVVCYPARSFEAICRRCSFWVLYFGTKLSIALGCLIFCRTEAEPQFWNLVGVFLGSVILFGELIGMIFNDDI